MGDGEEQAKGGAGSTPAPPQGRAAPALSPQREGNAEGRGGIRGE